MFWGNRSLALSYWAWKSFGMEVCLILFIWRFCLIKSLFSLMISCVRITKTCTQHFALTTMPFFQKDEIKSYEEHAKKLLEMTPPKGKDFLNKVEHILEREKNWVRTFYSQISCLLFTKILMVVINLLLLFFFWQMVCAQVWWKRDGCPPFEKQPMEKKVVQDGAKKRYADL